MALTEKQLGLLKRRIELSIWRLIKAEAKSPDSSETKILTEKLARLEAKLTLNISTE